VKRRELYGPALVLFAVMTAHALLETARDALFLARLGPQHLAWAYLAIAGVALVAVTAVRKLLGLRDPRRVLVAFLAGTTFGTAVLASVIPFAQSAVFVLYVWTGLVATLVVPCFWTVLDRSLHVGTAKRRFAAIGAGGVLGALVGSAAASLLGHVIEARFLVTAGAIVFGLATVAAIAYAPHPLREPAERPARKHRVAHEYTLLLVAVGLLATVTLTIGNLTFKRVVAERVPAEDLASAFGAIYTALNVLGLAIQLLVTPRLLSRLGVAGALMVLPVIVVATASGFALTGAVIAMIALAIGDGGLRHSLHRVASEILFLAVPPRVRDGTKPAVDAITLRGGQAAAALVVFAAGALGAGARTLAAVTAIMSLGWLATIAMIRGAYIAQFRNMLHAAEIRRDDHIPALDASSVALLRESLASPDESEALAALEILAHGGATIPPLVLYHPRHAVVLRALTLVDVAPAPLAYLVTHPDPQIRAAALATASRTHLPRECLDAARSDPEPIVRAAALVALAGEPAVDAAIAELAVGSPAEREALARAIEGAPHERHRATLYALLDDDQPAIVRIVLHVLARMPALADLDHLLPMLADPYVRGDVRRVFVAAGERGLARLVHALEDWRLPLAVRQHVPRTLSRFSSKSAATALVTRLPREPDGTTELKILRALGHMRMRDPDLGIDERVLHDYMRSAVADAARFAVLRDDLLALARPTPEVRLLADLLADKSRWSVEHAFRALGILHPRAGVRSVYEAIASADPARRGAAREVFEHLAPADLREPLLAVIDDLPPERRRARLGALVPRPFARYEDLLAALLAEPSASLRCIVAFHIAEQRITTLRPALARQRPLAESSLVFHAFDQAMARLDA
jgi:ATP/ADP translocase